MKLDLSSLEQALHSLKIALREWNRASSPFVKDSCIQRFEYTYELSHKMLKRTLERMSPSPEEIDRLSFQDLVRLAAEQGLLAHSWDKWSAFREARNSTSHAYSEKKADEVFAAIPDFAGEAAYLLQQLKARQAR